MKPTKKMRDTLKNAKTNLEQFLVPPTDNPYLPQMVDRLDLEAILFLILGGMCFGFILARVFT